MIATPAPINVMRNHTLGSNFTCATGDDAADGRAGADAARRVRVVDQAARAPAANQLLLLGIGPKTAGKEQIID